MELKNAGSLSGKVKIAFVISSTGWGGLEMNVIKLACELKATGWQPVLYCSSATKLYQEGLQCSVPVAALPGRTKYLAFRKAYLFGKVLKNTNVQTAVVFDNRDIDFIFIVKTFFFKELTTIYQQHMQVSISKKDWLHTMRYQSLNAWVSPLLSLKQGVIKYTNYPAEKVKVIPIGVQVAKLWPPHITRAEAHASLGICGSAIVMGVIGRIDPKKGQRFMVGALNHLRQKGYDVSLLIMGNPTINDAASEVYYQDLKSDIERWKLVEFVYLRQHNHNVQLFYQAIDIFVLPSEAETYGMVTIEAMLSEKPVVATNSGGTREILQEGKLGTLFEYNNIDQLCSQVEKLLEQPTQRQSMIHAAKQHAMKNFTSTSEQHQWHTMLSGLIPFTSHNNL